MKLSSSFALAPGAMQGLIPLYQFQTWAHAINVLSQRFWALQGLQRTKQITWWSQLLYKEGAFCLVELKDPLESLSFQHHPALALLSRDALFFYASPPCLPDQFVSYWQSQRSTRLSSRDLTMIKTDFLHPTLSLLDHIMFTLGQAGEPISMIGEIRERVARVMRQQCCRCWMEAQRH